MPETSALCFGPYRLAGPQGPLFRDNQAVKLPPKALEVLWLLARQAGEVVTKSALFDAVWPKTVVVENALAFQIQALRQVLEDDAKQPRYIATVHRIGFRFIAPVTTAAPPVVSRNQIESSAQHLAANDGQRATAFVGRAAQLARLQQLYTKALRGERQVVFVTGEAGIGKTTLVETFLAQVGREDTETRRHGDTESKEPSPRLPFPASPRHTAPLSPSPPLIGRGQCVEQHGAGEAYLPMLEALSRLCRQARGDHIIDVLQQVAPTWLLQMPALLAPDEVAALHQRTAGATRERMLREIAEALEVWTDIGATHASPLLLVLEDLHWSDTSTIEMLALLARRREPARLLVLATYRPTEVILADHPLKAMKQELVARGQGVEITLGNLRPADVHAYLTQRFLDTTEESTLSTFVYQRTEGHPLFMVQMADYLTQQDAPGEIASGAQGTFDAVVPHGLQELIEVQLGRLTAAQRQVLEMASVAGAEFAVASISAGVQRPIEDVEAHCESLAQHGQFIEERGLATWPDGTVSGRYGFRHALYQEVLYRRLSVRQRTQLHFRIGVREEAGYGERSSEVAAELAVHFERGRDSPRAIHYHQQAGEKALQRSANTEAIVHFTKGLELLTTLPETPERAQPELRLHVGLSLAFVMTKGYAAVEVERVSTRARALCQQMEETPEVCSAMFRLYQFYAARGELDAAHELAEQLLRIAERAQAPALLSRAHMALAHELVSRGDFPAAQEHAEQSLAHYDPRQYRALGVVSGDDPGTVALVVRMLALQVRGYPDQATATMQQCVAAAQALSLPYALSAVLTSVAELHLLARASRAGQESAEAALALSTQEGFPYFLARATILRGWALTEQGQGEAGLTQIRQGLAAYQEMGASVWKPRYLGLLAEAYGKAGQVDKGLAVLAEALEITDRTEEGEYAAELYRLKGALTLLKLPVGSGQWAVGSRKAERPQSQSRKATVRNSLLRLRSGQESAIPNPQLAEAEECFHQALAIARQQEAKLFELRATVSLSRVWQPQGKRKEAHQMLAEVYGWFTEGFDTPDLTEAKALLEELGNRGRGTGKKKSTDSR